MSSFTTLMTRRFFTLSVPQVLKNESSSRYERSRFCVAYKASVIPCFSTLVYFSSSFLQASAYPVALSMLASSSSSIQRDISFISPSRLSLKRLSLRNTCLAALRAGFMLSASGMKPRTALKPPKADSSLLTSLPFSCNWAPACSATGAFFISVSAIFVSFFQFLIIVTLLP